MMIPWATRAFDRERVVKKNNTCGQGYRQETHTHLVIDETTETHTSLGGGDMHTELRQLMSKVAKIKGCTMNQDRSTSEMRQAKKEWNN